MFVIALLAVTPKVFVAFRDIFKYFWLRKMGASVVLKTLTSKWVLIVVAT